MNTLEALYVAADEWFLINRHLQLVRITAPFQNVSFLTLLCGLGSNHLDTDVSWKLGYIQ